MENPFKIEHNRNMLESLVEQAGFKWGNYTSKRPEVIKALREEKLIIWPDTHKYPKKKDKQIATLESVVDKQDGRVVVIPFDSGIIPDARMASVSKKGFLLNLRYDGNSTAHDLLQKKMREVRITDSFVGYDWQDPSGNDRRYIVSTLIDCIKGSILDTRVDDKSIKVRPYLGKNEEEGRYIAVEGLPSLEKKRKYDLRIEGLCLSSPEFGVTDPKKSYSLHTSHECGKGAFYPVKYGRKSHIYPGRKEFAMRKGDEKLECYHSILAVKKAKKVIKAGYGLDLHDPFIEPSVKTRDLFYATRNSMLFEDREGYLRRFNEVASEIIMWKMIGYRNHTRKNKQ